MDIINKHESEVRSYCRDYPAVFQRAKGCHLYDVDGKEYLDFFAGAGALNYGHNPPDMQRALLGYITQDGITHSLDKATVAKEAFLKRFDEVILKPRKMSYKVQFPGPTGTNAVEAALKLARKVTGRDTVIGFTNAFHGMTLGSLAVTGNGFKRSGAGVPLNNTVSMPYSNFLGQDTDTIEFLDAYIQGNGSGVSLPAAIILETVQAEGGLHTASKAWLRAVQDICRKHEILLIVDDVQAGCGRTGTFFSFEEAGLDPDLICLSKSISGYGLPMALTLIRPKLDQWAPGEHNGTFRGHNLAFVTATEALARWETDELSEHVKRNEATIRDFLTKAAKDFPVLEGEVRGRGMIQGLACVPGVAEKVLAAAFKRGLILETSGPDSEVVKILPALVIEEVELKKGLKIVRECLEEVAKSMEPARVTRQSA